MATATSSEANLYLSITTPLASDRFEVLGISGHEQISGLFDYSVEMGSHDIDLDFSALLGKSVTVTLNSEDGASQYRNGIVASLTQKLDEGGMIVYHARVVPWLWLLTKTSDSRIFQHQTVPEIIETVFSDLGFTDFRNATNGTYEKREYCVQYNETHFDFVSRLMEDEGIFYFFEHLDGGHVLVFADDPDAHVVCPGLGGTVRYRQVESSWVEENGISSCTFEQQIVLNEYRMTDYNFETPSTNLLVSVQGQSNGVGTLAMYEYPGGYGKTVAGEKRAQRRIESHELGMKLFRGNGNARDFTAGYRFTLSEHNRTELNTEYVLRSVSLYVTQERYSNSFEAFPSDVPFRPEHLTPKPLLHGYEVGTVVGRSGEEIWTDEYGRVKVHFPWDTRSQRNENSSCWIRVAQAWAGKGWGSMSIPRMGAEVIVCFLGGDPDRPLIVGTVYNAQQTIPYTMPENKTQSTFKTDSSKGSDGYNEIRFEDKKGKEELFIQAQKNNVINVKNNRTETVGNDEKVHIGNDQTLTVDGKHAQTIKKDTSIEITEGNYTHSVSAGTADYTVEGAIKEVYNDTQMTTVANDITISSDGGAIMVKAANSITLVVGSSMLEMKSDGSVTLNGSKIAIEGTSEITETAPKVQATGSTEASMGVGSNSVICDTAQVAISGSMVKSSAMGVNEITGATVKLN